jgi:inner membrane protein
LDSLTQVVLGASVAAVCVPQPYRRKAAVMGAILGTLPDLDVFIDYNDAVANFTNHRSFSHSLFVLFPFSLLIWLLLKKQCRPVNEAPLRWWLAISLALLTHPILDAHTAYGTQLFWPLTSPPVSWSTIFIIDPLYTLPLLLGTLIILIKPSMAWAGKLLTAGLVVSSSYLAWTWVAKLDVEQQVISALNNKSSNVFSTPTPFNSLLWRIVVIEDEQYLEGFYSLLQPELGVRFTAFPLNSALLQQSKHLAAVKRLDWFTQGFISVNVEDDHVVIADLRMGFSGNYVFNHAVAKHNAPHVAEISSTLLPYQFNPKDLAFVWQQLTD